MKSSKTLKLAFFITFGIAVIATATYFIYDLRQSLSDMTAENTLLKKKVADFPSVDGGGANDFQNATVTEEKVDLAIRVGNLFEKKA